MKDEGMKELSILLDICGTFQASNANCEFGFSLMDSIKTKSRNRLQLNHLDNLMCIKFPLSSGNILLIWSRCGLQALDHNADRRENLAINERMKSPFALKFDLPIFYLQFL